MRELTFDTALPASKTGRMNLRQFVKYWLWRDATHRGEFAALRRLMTPDFPASWWMSGQRRLLRLKFIPVRRARLACDPRGTTPESFCQAAKTSSCQTQRNLPESAPCAEKSGAFPLYVGNDGEAPSTSTLSVDPELLKLRTKGTIMVQVERLTDVLATQQIQPDFGLLTVDVEGMDLEVLQGLDFSRHRPRMIITEDYPPKFPAKSELLKKNGYQFRTQVSVNSIWTAS